MDNKTTKQTLISTLTSVDEQVDAELISTLSSVVKNWKFTPAPVSPSVAPAPCPPVDLSNWWVGQLMTELGSHSGRVFVVSGSTEHSRVKFQCKLLDTMSESICLFGSVEGITSILQREKSGLIMINNVQLGDLSFSEADLVSLSNVGCRQRTLVVFTEHPPTITQSNVKAYKIVDDQLTLVTPQPVPCSVPSSLDWVEQLAEKVTLDGRICVVGGSDDVRRVGLLTKLYTKAPCLYFRSESVPQMMKVLEKSLSQFVIIDDTNESYSIDDTNSQWFSHSQLLELSNAGGRQRTLIIFSDYCATVAQSNTRFYKVVNNQLITAVPNKQPEPIVESMKFANIGLNQLYGIVASTTNYAPRLTIIVDYKQESIKPIFGAVSALKSDTVLTIHKKNYHAIIGMLVTSTKNTIMLNNINVKEIDLTKYHLDYLLALGVEQGQVPRHLIIFTDKNPGVNRYTYTQVYRFTEHGLTSL